MNKITNYQLFTLVVLYEIGTTIIFGFAASAGRAAWISVLISASIGILINIVYFKLMNMNKGLALVEWFPAQFGKWIGVPIAWMYVIEFIYDGGRGIGDLEILIPGTILPKTPIIVVELIFISVLTYALFSGIEVIGRLGEVFFPIIMVMYFIEILLIFGSDIIDVNNIRPYLGEGWKSIWESVWPLGITQSFGQTIEFAMIWPLVKKTEKIMKTTLFATMVSGVFIASLDVLAILVLGENMFTKSTLPLFRMIRIINIGDFAENLDTIGVIYLLTTAFLKICIHLFCAVRGIQLLVNTESKLVAIPLVAISVLYLGANMASSSSEHIEVGLKVIPYNLWFPLFYIFPLVLFVVTMVRNKVKFRYMKQI